MTHAYRCPLGSGAELVRNGPVVLGKLRPSREVREAMQMRGEFVPPQQVKLLIDTGASFSMVSRSLATGLGLQPLRRHAVVGVSQKAEMCWVYEATLDLWLEGPSSRVEVALPLSVTGVADAHADVPHDAVVSGLLGRDFLASFVLLYDGPRARFELRTERVRAED
ncbi:MAG: hypothetical protein JWM10_5208 [Myxococcaceae bacterium]|nr:hypothetical protein [Myxococcaceae bacterium]